MKLHLGCGKRYIEGFTHIDLAKYDHIDFEMPVDKLNIFSNNSIDEIYASHVIEYFDRDKVKIVLEEWYRVLKPGGLLRLAVPNFNSLIKVSCSSLSMRVMEPFGIPYFIRFFS